MDGKVIALLFIVMLSSAISWAVIYLALEWWLS